MKTVALAERRRASETLTRIRQNLGRILVSCPT
jgi:hypothetical protein